MERIFGISIVLGLIAPAVHAGVRARSVPNLVCTAPAAERPEFTRPNRRAVCLVDYVVNENAAPEWRDALARLMAEGYAKRFGELQTIELGVSNLTGDAPVYAYLLIQTFYRSSDPSGAIAATRSATFRVDVTAPTAYVHPARVELKSIAVAPEGP